MSTSLKESTEFINVNSLSHPYDCASIYATCSQVDMWSLHRTSTREVICFAFSVPQESLRVLPNIHRHPSADNETEQVKNTAHYLEGLGEKVLVALSRSREQI